MSSLRLILVLLIFLLDIVSLFQFSLSQSGNPFSTLKATVSSAATSNLVVFAGGTSTYNGTPSDWYDTVDIFNIQTNLWEVAPSLPSPRRYSATCNTPLYAIFAGGVYDSEVISEIAIYSESLKGWLPPLNLSQPVSLASCVFSSAYNVIIVAGGTGDAFEMSDHDSITLLNYQSNGITLAPTPPSLYLQQARKGMVALTYQQYVLFAGGTYSNDTYPWLVSDQVDLIDLSSMSILTGINNLTTPRAGHDGVVLQGRAYIAGGMYATQSNNWNEAWMSYPGIEVFDFNTLSWTSSIIWTPRYWLSVTAFPNAAILAIAGGRNAANIYGTDTIDLYNVTSATWLPPIRISDTRFRMSGELIHNRWVLASGELTPDRTFYLDVIPDSCSPNPFPSSLNNVAYCNGTAWIIPGNVISTLPSVIDMTTSIVISGNVSFANSSLTINMDPSSLYSISLMNCANLTNVELLVNLLSDITNDTQIIPLLTYLAPCETLTSSAFKNVTVYGPMTCKDYSAQQQTSQLKLTLLLSTSSQDCTNENSDNHTKEIIMMIVVAAVVGGIILMAIILVIVLLCKHRSRHTHRIFRSKE